MLEDVESFSFKKSENRMLKNQARRASIN